jgi:hypothetical protein
LSGSEDRTRNEEWGQAFEVLESHMEEYGLYSGHEIWGGSLSKSAECVERSIFKMIKGKSEEYEGELFGKRTCLRQKA